MISMRTLDLINLKLVSNIKQMINNTYCKINDIAMYSIEWIDCSDKNTFAFGGSSEKHAPIFVGTQTELLPQREKS